MNCKGKIRKLWTFSANNKNEGLIFHDKIELRFKTNWVLVSIHKHRVNMHKILEDICSEIEFKKVYQPLIQT